jgi:hypothetical protein
MDRQTGRTDGQRDKPLDGQTDRQVDRTGGQTDRQTNRRTDEWTGGQVRIRHWRSHLRRATRGWPFWKRLLRAYSIADQREVDPGHQVGLELGQVDVEGAVKTEQGCRK